MDCKIIKFILIIFFVSFKVLAVEFDGKFIQGHFIIGKTNPDSKIKIDKKVYELSADSALWGSLMVGIMTNMRNNLEWADKLMLKLFELVPSHTIEPFSLSESLLMDFQIKATLAKLCLIF